MFEGSKSNIIWTWVEESSFLPEAPSGLEERSSFEQSRGTSTSTREGIPRVPEGHIFVFVRVRQKSANLLITSPAIAKMTKLVHRDN